MTLGLGRPIDEVWQALTDGAHTPAWLGQLDGSVVAEGDVVAIWHDAEVRSTHTVRRLRPGRVLALTWDFPRERPSLVTFVLTPAPTPTPTGSGTLTVHHERLDDAVSYAAGWHRHLTYLDAHLNGADIPMADFWADHDSLLDLYGGQER